MKPSKVLRSRSDGNRTKGTSPEEPKTSNRYDLQIAECKGSRTMEREVKPLTTGARYGANRMGPHGRARHGE